MTTTSRGSGDAEPDLQPVLASAMLAINAEITGSLKIDFLLIMTILKGTLIRCGVQHSLEARIIIVQFAWTNQPE